MTSPASSEASEIRRRGRQRLIGAIALVMLLVVFVPMVLDSEPRPARPQASIPPRDSAPALPAPSPAAPPAAKPAPAVARTDPVPPKADGVLAKAEPAKGDAVPAKAPAADAKAATPKLAGFAVQVGAFRDEAKLKQARDKLVASGVPHYTERLEASGGALTRLRAGPFATREAAETAQASLKRAALDGKVIPLP